LRGAPVEPGHHDPVRPVILLAHSPVVGPETLLPLALVLAQGGWSTSVPDLRPVATGDQATAARIVIEALGPSGPDGRRVVLVGHGRAGAWLPAIGTALHPVGWSVAATVFLDAVLPPVAPGVPRATPPELVAHLDTLTGPDGMVPRWPAWWPPEAVVAELGDGDLRRRVEAGCLPVPRRLFDVVPEVPGGWPGHPVGYLALTCGALARAAVELGWSVRRHQPGGHFAAAARPAAVAGVLLRLLGDLGVEGGRPDRPPHPAAGPAEVTSAQVTGSATIDLRDPPVGPDR
jgi:hypothetical protein